MHVWKYATLSVGGPAFSCDVGVSGATTDKNSVTFNRVHTECGSQIKQPSWCPECKLFLEAHELSLKPEGLDVLVSEAEVKEAKGETAPVLPITKFLPWEASGIYREKKSYYLLPPKVDYVGVYPHLVAAMMDEQVDGFGHANLGGRDKPFLVKAIDGRLELRMLYAWHELVEPDFKLPPDTKIKPDALKMARTIMRTMTEPLDDAFDLKSDPEQALHKLIKAKAAGKPAPKPKKEPKPDATNDLMVALKETYELVVS